MVGTNRVSFLYDMISADVFRSRTYSLDERVLVTEAAITAIVGKEDGYHYALSECVTYTKDLTFAWIDGVPDEFRAFEEFWALYKRGVAVDVWFPFYAEQVDNIVLIGQREQTRIEPTVPGDEQSAVSHSSLPRVMGWHGALAAGMKTWSPPTAWKLFSELPEDQRRDPLE